MTNPSKIVGPRSFALMAALLLSTAVTASADSIRLHAYVPASGTPAQGEPPCYGGTPSSDEIIDAMHAVGTFAGYGDITGAIANNSWLSNRLKVMFGAHDGPSICRVACGRVPSRPTTYEACVDGAGGCYTEDAEKYLDTNFGGAWARAIEAAYEPRDGDYYTCFLFKNWKHDWDRNFTVTIQY